MQTSIFIKPNLERCFPEWNRINLINLCITILVKITELHRRNIIVGDINGLNILVKDDLNVYFVDTDSYQVEQYPCPVGTVNFTAPEIQELSYENFFRTKQHEYFALATLIFMILLPGKPPYSHRGGSTPFTGIKSGNFSYPLGEWNTDSTPMGPWRFIWSNLPYHLKEAFTNIFRKKEKRIGAEEWIAVMKRYKNDLKKGFMGIYGDNPFPPYFKITDRVDITCSMCNKQLVRDRKEIDGLTKRRQNVLCSDCREVIHETSNNQSELI